MIMMDVGMYGHGQQHSGAGNYSQAEPFYGYGADIYSPGHSSSVHQLQNPHYPNPYHYEDGSYICSSDSVDAPPSPQDINYYHQPGPSLQDPIISTESGLSYTNLDYATSSGYPHHQQNVYVTDEYQRSDVLIRQQEGVADRQFYQESKYHGQHVDNDGYGPHHLGIQNSTNACMDYQHHRRYKEEVLNVDADRLHCSRPHHGLPHMSPVAQSSSSIPTYKWMQVKRNVPKPQGKTNQFFVFGISYDKKMHAFK